jgi:ubiquitin carboxyl-terminal hydrolase 9/24
MDLPEYPPEYYEYQLRGVIIHMGTADSGHYYSLIKDGNTSNWFEFNDTIVKPFDINDLAAEAFGNDEKRSATGGQSYGGMSKDRSRNAYMVFYERVVYVDDNGKALKNENELNWYFNKAGEEDLNKNGDNA